MVDSGRQDDRPSKGFCSLKPSAVGLKGQGNLSRSSSLKPPVGSSLMSPSKISSRFRADLSKSKGIVKGTTARIMDKEGASQDAFPGEQIAGTTLPAMSNFQSPAKAQKRNACTTIYLYFSATP